MANAVEVENLSYSYGARRALEGLTFSVGEGEIFGFLGPNGGGKSTAFKVLSTLHPPQGGLVRIFGSLLPGERGAARARMGVVFQSPALDRKLTVRENLRHHGHLYGFHGADLARRMEGSLESLGLRDRAGEFVEKLSGGLQRRVELAKALLSDPKLLILDEPSTGLDPAARRDFWAQIHHLRKTRGMTILATTHYLEEADRCDRLLLLDGGKAVALGSPAELKAEIGGEVLKLRVLDPEAALGVLREKFKLEAVLVDGEVRVRKEKLHTLVAPLLEQLGRDVVSVTLGPPNLEDVFLHKTGKRLWNEENR